MARPTPEQQLRIRALRILTDRRPHESQALTWAADLVGWRVTGARESWASLERRHGFTLRELSLGAQPIHHQEKTQ